MYRQGPPVAGHSLRTQSHPAPKVSTTFHQPHESPRQVLPYQTIDQRLVSSHQSLYESSEQDHPSFQSGYMGELVPSIEGSSQGNGQPKNVIAVQRPHQNFTPPNLSQEKALPHRPVAQRVVSYADNSASLAKRRKIDDVDLQDHSFWQAEQQQQERLALVPLNDRDRQVKYINYSDLRQQVGETRLVPPKESISSHRQHLDSHEQGNLAKFSSSHQERVMIRPVQTHEARGQASRISASFAPISSYSPKSASQMSQAVLHEKGSVLQRSDRPIEYKQHGLQRPDPAGGRPPEGHSSNRWEDSRREVIVIDSSPEAQRSVRAIPFHDGASSSSRAIPIRSLQAQGTHYEARPTSHLEFPEGAAETRSRIVLQNGETLRRYRVAPEVTHPIKQDAKPVLIRQPESYTAPVRRDTTQDQVPSRYFAPQQQQLHSPDTNQERRWYETGFGVSSRCLCFTKLFLGLPSRKYPQLYEHSIARRILCNNMLLIHPNLHTIECLRALIAAAGSSTQILDARLSFWNRIATRSDRLHIL